METVVERRVEWSGVSGVEWSGVEWEVDRDERGRVEDEGERYDKFKSS